MKIKRKNKVVEQVTYEGNHPTAGTVFVISWKILKNLVEYNFRNKKEKVESFKITDSGIIVFTNGADMSDHFPFKDEVYHG